LLDGFLRVKGKGNVRMVERTLICSCPSFGCGIARVPRVRGFPTSVTKTACCMVRDCCVAHLDLEIVLQVGRMRGPGVPGVKVRLNCFSEFV
jgi:hypothetical protein